ncbi:alkaline phosphatase [uncultured Cocleimonas sp.]|uniref:alkaline phosphatase D family protein n=1 Tax=uncultured Cocleimonas sp. TaxID=1051587 RepID=UPI002634EB1C|nr:alkaline phosphatase D family protein [uncultured Cocleimonas sp.]
MDKYRRRFLSLSTGVIISTGLINLGLSDEKKLGNGQFLHGVASGDPLQDKVIIWTRLSPEKVTPSIGIIYEVSHKNDFSTLIHTGIVYAERENDFTVKVDLNKLEPGTRYYYRFRSANNVSTIGNTITLPSHTKKMTFAVFSCSNFTSGYFNVYRDVCKLKNKIDLIIHLGDYIYEYGMYDESGKPAYGTKNSVKSGRQLPDDNDKALKSLNDYRRRYSLYRSDPDLQELHKNFPVISIWDDHEILNNVYALGVYDNDMTSNEYEKQKKSAIKAYYEWLPIRPPYGSESEKIYRSFHFGDLLSLYMLDTRLLSRSAQFDYSDYIKDQYFDEITFKKDISSSKRSLLGQDQLEWLESELSNSNTRWQFIAQQVKVTNSNVPLEIIKAANKYFKSEDKEEKAKLKKQITDSYYETSRIKARMTLNDATLTDDEKNRLSKMLPYNLDAWDGYPSERENLYKILKSVNKPNVILSGDTHFSWASKFVNKLNQVLGIELGTTSVTSPGLEEDYDIDDPKLLRQLEDSVNVFDKNSLYSNFTDRGYLIVEVEEDEVKAHWRYISNILSREYSVLNERSHQLRIAYKNNQYYFRHR